MNHANEKSVSHWIERTKTLIFTIDRQLTCVPQNTYSQKTITGKHSQSVQTNFADLLDISEKEKSNVQRQIRDAIKSRKKISLQLPTRIPGIKPVKIDWYFTPVSDSAKDEPQMLAYGLFPEQGEMKGSRVEFESFAQIFNPFPFMVAAVDEMDTVVVWNREAVNLTGFELIELNKDASLVDSILFSRDEISKFAAQGESVQEKTLEKQIKTKTGDTRHIQWTNLSEDIPVSGIKFWAIGLDITAQYQVNHERQQLEAELFWANKMESIGALAGGVAHDFNNLLVGILGYASLLQTILPTDGEAFQCVQEISQSAQRMSKLTRQLVTFSRGGKSEPVPTDINTVVSNTIAFVARTLDPGIKVLNNFEKPLPLLYADPVQLQQVIVNLISNSAEAIQKPGFIKISTKQQSVIKGESTQKKVLLTVEDTGVGMDALSLEKIYEPFFSTKSQGRGLGMAVVSRIVKIHKGEIFIDNQQGRGTTVSISFPASLKSSKPNVEPPPAKLASGSESILVIDDEKVTLDIIKFSLERVGYKIFTAIDGRAGMEVLKDHPEIDLIILDVVMPGIAGVPLFKRLKKIKPEVKILLCSGYDETGPAKEILHLGANGFLHKPFEVTLLADVIKKILKEN